MEKKKISQLKINDYFKLQETETSPVWVRGEFIREEMRYSCYKFDDVNHEKLMKGSKEVFVGFEF